MPLSNNNQFGFQAMTEAINALPVNPSIIRGLGIFKPKYLTTTNVRIEIQDGVISLVQSQPYGSPGQPVATKNRNSFMLEVPHFPQDDLVLAAEVQNVREFGTNKPLKPIAKVNEKLADMKSNLEYTREHLMLGALQGKIYDADGTVLVDLYKQFGLTRKIFNLELSNDSVNINKNIDSLKSEQNKQRKGETVTSWVVLASAELMREYVYHKSIKELYDKYQAGATKYLGDTEIMFEHKNINFIEYSDAFGTAADIKDGEGLLLPLGTRDTFKENFAPADTNAAANTPAKAYYASREKMKHDKGWELSSQTNSLPIVKRPNLCATIKMV